MSVLPITLVQGSAAHRVYVAGAWLVVVAAIVLVPLAGELGFAPGSIDKPFRIGQINSMIAFAVAILGLNLVTGYSGQLCLGQSAFVGLGAYTTAILIADHHWTSLATLPVSAAVCLVAGLLVGVPATRVRGMYLAVVTLCVAYAFPSIVRRYDWLTGGVGGKGPGRTEAKLLPPSWMPFADDRRSAGPLWAYCILVVIAAGLFLLARNLVGSRIGRALRAVRDDEASASSSGIDVSRYKAAAFGLSAVYGGLAGSMLMINRPFASDVQFTTTMAIFLLVGFVVGGSGTISGAVPGAFVYLFVPYYVSEWAFDQNGIPFGLRQATGPLFALLRPSGGAAAGILFGLALLVMVFVMPGGIVAGLRTLRARVVVVTPNPPWLIELRRSQATRTDRCGGVRPLADPPLGDDPGKP